MPDDFDPFADPGRSASPQPLSGRLGDLRAQMARERLEGPRRRRPVASLIALGLTLLAAAGIGWAAWYGITAAVETRAASLGTAAQVSTLGGLIAFAALVVAVVAVVREHPRVVAVISLVAALVLPWVAFGVAVDVAWPFLQADVAALGAGSVREWLADVAPGDLAGALFVRVLEVLAG